MKKTFFVLFLFAYSHGFSQVTHVQEDDLQSYNPDKFISSETKILSNNEIAIKNYRYPKDIITGVCTTPPAFSDAAGLNYLINRNVINSPVETQTAVLKSTGIVYVTDANYINYYSDKPYAKDLYKLEIASPITNFIQCHLDPTTCDVMKDSRYVWQESYTIYDLYGNVLEKKIKGNQYVSSIYFYKGLYKVADVVNATNSQIAYTSFETDDQGFWNYLPSGIVSGPTVSGSHSYNISGNSLYRGLPSGNYTLSFWVLGYSASMPITVTGLLSSITETTGPTVNGWTYKEYKLMHTFDANITASGAPVLIDEVRLYPEDALMETKGYNPLVGVSYTCDVANHINYYTYDDLGRLLYVKDLDGNIIKKMEYGLKKVE